MFFKADFTEVTLEQQYEVVKSETNTSDVTTYGDLVSRLV